MESGFGDIVLCRGFGENRSMTILYKSSLDNVIFAEGPALIYDNNVMKAIQNDIWKGEFSKTKENIGSSKNLHQRGVQSYGLYLSEAKQLADRLKVNSDQIELALFRSQVNPKSLWS